MSADERLKFPSLVAALTEAKVNETWHEKLGWSDEAWSRILILASKKEPSVMSYV